MTVWLQDNGGTLNGGVDTSAPQTFTITIQAGSPQRRRSRTTMARPTRNAGDHLGAANDMIRRDSLTIVSIVPPLNGASFRT